MTAKAKEVGYRIRKIREAKDLNQQNMADKLDITAGAYAKIERGETDPSITRLYEIAGILKVDILNFLEDEPHQKESSATRTEFNTMHTQIGVLNKEIKRLDSEFKSLKKTTNKK